jgi:hypothetical protein
MTFPPTLFVCLFVCLFRDAVSNNFERLDDDDVDDDDDDVEW